MGTTCAVNGPWERGPLCSFEYVSEHCALFKGQLKTRGAEREAYPIPLLAPFRVIKAGLDALRAKQSAQAPCDKVGERYHGAMSRELEKRFPAVGHIHLLRSMYVRCVSEKFNCECVFAGLCKAVLGHQDLHETLFYSSTHIRGYETDTRGRGLVS